jgi:flavin-dependent dehydrogenase
MINKPIVINGAGLSGLVAGINLVNAGCRVIIREKERDCGLRFKNDFQGISNWMMNMDMLAFMKTMDIKIDFYVSTVDSGIFLGPGRKNQANFKTTHSLLYLVRRGKLPGCLDYSLKRQFLKKGGLINFDQSGLEDADIIAVGPQKAKFRTLGYNFKTDLGDIVCEIMDDNIAPKGYAYLLIRNGCGTLGSILVQNYEGHDKSLDSAVEIFQKEFNLKIDQKEKFSGFAGFANPKTAIFGNKLYVGEAAGFTDGFTGFGMFYAIRSGYLAAKSIIENKNYDTLWKNDFGNLLKAGIVNRFFYEAIGNMGLKWAPGFIKKNCYKLPDILRKSYSFGFIHKIIFPFAISRMKNKLN